MGSGYYIKELVEIDLSTYDSTTTWDEAHAEGYWGTKMDPYPNDVYTVQGADPMMASATRDRGEDKKRGPGRPPKTD